MDAAGIEATMYGRQGWGHSRTTTDTIRETYLRYVEVDTLRVLYRGRKNDLRSAELTTLRQAIARVYDRLSGDAWKEVATLLNATSGNPCR
jgi:hypothetical protein